MLQKCQSNVRMSQTHNETGIVLEKCLFSPTNVLDSYFQLFTWPLVVSFRARWPWEQEGRPEATRTLPASLLRYHDDQQNRYVAMTTDRPGSKLAPWIIARSCLNDLSLLLHRIFNSVGFRDELYIVRPLWICKCINECVTHWVSDSVGRQMSDWKTSSWNSCSRVGTMEPH